MGFIDRLIVYGKVNEPILIHLQYEYYVHHLSYAICFGAINIVTYILESDKVVIKCSYVVPRGMVKNVYFAKMYKIIDMLFRYRMNNGQNNYGDEGIMLEYVLKYDNYDIIVLLIK